MRNRLSITVITVVLGLLTLLGCSGDSEGGPGLSDVFTSTPTWAKIFAESYAESAAEEEIGDVIHDRSGVSVDSTSIQQVTGTSDAHQKAGWIVGGTTRAENGRGGHFTGKWVVTVQWDPSLVKSGDAQTGYRYGEFHLTLD